MFAIADANKSKRPAIVSHGAPRGTTATEYKLNLSEATINGIRDRGGVVGVIFYDHWLLPPGAPSSQSTSIQQVIDAMTRIQKVAGTTACIAIGSDLDGFIQPVTGLENVAKFRDLEAELKKNFKSEEVEGILWNNAMRTLSMGWG